MLLFHRKINWFVNTNVIIFFLTMLLSQFNLTGLVGAIIHLLVIVSGCIIIPYLFFGALVGVWAVTFRKGVLPWGFYVYDTPTSTRGLRSRLSFTFGVIVLISLYRLSMLPQSISFFWLALIAGLLTINLGYYLQMKISPESKQSKNHE